MLNLYRLIRATKLAQTTSAVTSYFRASDGGKVLTADGSAIICGVL